MKVVCKLYVNCRNLNFQRSRKISTFKFKKMLKNIFKKIVIITLELILISGALWFVAQKKGISPGEILPAITDTFNRAEEEITGETEIVFPSLENPIMRTFAWEYKGKEYALSQTLHGSVYDYYKKQPKTFSYSGELPVNWEEEYYGMFLRNNEHDNTISNLASDLQALGQKNKLNEDQIVELIMSFVQAIPYDDSKAKNILSETGSETMRYPYEVLFEQLGVCSDKSLLAIVLLRQMGYGAVIFTFDQQNHMAIGIECPKDSSTYGSGYCYAETTSLGNKIGIIPSFDSTSNKTINVSQLAEVDSDQSTQAKLQQLGLASMFQETHGNLYFGILETNKISNEIAQLKNTIEKTLPQLQLLKKKVTSQEKSLLDMKKELEEYRDEEDIKKFNTLVGKYNELLEEYRSIMKKYNNIVALYNKTIQRYNLLIKQ